MSHHEGKLERIFRENYGVKASERPAWFEQFRDSYCISIEKRSYKNKRHIMEEEKVEEITPEDTENIEEAQEPVEETEKVEEAV